MSTDPTAAHTEQDAEQTAAASSEPAGQPTGPAGQPSEEEMRAAYEAELSRITSADMILQAAVSLLNLGGRRLGLAPGAEQERDLEQVRDAVDGVRALFGILERSASAQELRPLRDALSQLQMAYARDAQAPGAGAGTDEPNAPAPGGAGAPSAPAADPRPGAKDAAGQTGAAPSEKQPGAGPAESSGRLWVPGR